MDQYQDVVQCVDQCQDGVQCLHQYLDVQLMCEFVSVKMNLLMCDLVSRCIVGM